MSTVRMLFFGDLMGQPGCSMFQKYACKLKQLYNADAVIVNGENSASNGRGISPKTYNAMKHNGADIITGGNHSFHQRDSHILLAEKKDVLRPLNFPNECPGRGVTTFQVNGQTIGIVNVQGRIFMREQLSCPFKAVDSALTYLKSHTNMIIVDMHAETTSEKSGMAYYLDGRVSAVLGTHTHVQTADHRVLPGGTAFITDAGMAGALNSMIGMEKEAILRNMTTQLPVRFSVDHEPPYVISGVVLDVNCKTGNATSIEPFRVTEEKKII